MQVKSESEVAQSCPTLSDLMTAAHQAPPSVGFSMQEYWSGVPLPSLCFVSRCVYLWASLAAQRVKNLPTMQNTQVHPLDRDDPLGKGMATYSSILS